MKKRARFVSNSSSTSFTAIGVMVGKKRHEERNEIRKILGIPEEPVATPDRNTWKDCEAWYDDFYARRSERKIFVGRGEEIGLYGNQNETFVGKILSMFTREDDLISEGVYDLDEIFGEDIQALKQFGKLVLYSGSYPPAVPAS